MRSSPEVKSPLLSHPHSEPSSLTPDDLVESVRRSRGISCGTVPPLCILEFDGDLTDWLVEQGIAAPFRSWPCFHTKMFAIDLDGVACGIIPRTIGGPYAVMVAEQLAVAGARLIVGLSSAGRVAPELPLPCLVTITSAVRDEGTSLHYLAASATVACPAPEIVPLLESELGKTGWTGCSGKVWTTDAPYRETRAQLKLWAAEGILAVDMQTASLFAFGMARSVAVASVAMVSNAVDYQGPQFDTGSMQDGLRILQSIGRAARSYFLK